MTASEVAGAHYHDVVSLSGAGMPQSWHACDTTKYRDLSYMDSLQEAQIAGGDLVWNGNTPRASTNFTKGPYYEGPRDSALRLPDGTPYAFNQGVLLSNHNLVATGEPGNENLLRDLRMTLFDLNAKSGK